MRIEVDPDVCASTGLCEAIAPRHFRVDDLDPARVLVAEVGDQAGPELRDNVERAVATCPTGAIRLLEVSSGS